MVNIDRKPPRLAVGERETLMALWQYQRESVVRKVEGLDPQQASRRLVDSDTTLLWLVRHLIRAESLWILGRFAGRHDEVRAAWKKSMTGLAKRQNIAVKVGGLGMAMGWFDFYQRPTPPGSPELAEAFKPWVETCIELFGVNRCMYESNFPVDKITSGYGVLWNAFKRISAKASASEKTALFSGTASRVYKL